MPFRECRGQESGLTQRWQGDFETPQSAALEQPRGGFGGASRRRSEFMSHGADPRAVLRRRRWPLFLPFALVLLLAAAWTGVWFYAAARAEAEIAAWRAREWQAGRHQDCASQSIGGYPFRIEVRCGAATFELKGTPTLRLSLPSVLTAVQVYDPTLLISEFQGPLDISEPDQPPRYIVNWNLGQASVRGLPSTVERASLVLEAPTVSDRTLVGSDLVFRAQRLELHGRRAPGSAPDNPLIETVLRLNAAIADKLHHLAAQPIDAEIATVLRGVTDVVPKPWPQRFKEWQARDGQIEIIKARIQQEDVIAMGAGTLRLTARGGLDGNLQVTVVGIEKVLKMFDIERIMSEGQIGATISALDRLIPGLGGLARQSAGPSLVAALGQRTVLEDKPAVAFPVRFADGTVYLGPFQVGQVPPLF
jgi:hypothetical protein